MSEPTKEYWQAKADLCAKQAVKDLQVPDVAKAMRNIERANLALSRIFNLEESEDD